jgi:hypothetical protein
MHIVHDRIDRAVLQTGVTGYTGIIDYYRHFLSFLLACTVPEIIPSPTLTLGPLRQRGLAFCALKFHMTNNI